MIHNIFRPLVMIVLDGMGIAPAGHGNAVTKASTPFLESVWDSCPHTFLQASEGYVGLPPGIKGNSEVGHMNLGSGRIVFQELPRINRAIESGSFYQTQAFINAVNHANNHKSKLHTAICLSDAGTHGTITHLEALLQFLANQKFTQPVLIHAYTDGRDSPPKSAAKYFERVDRAIKKTGVGTFATVTGRYYAMDRNEVWDRVEKAYDLFTLGTGNNADSWQNAIEAAYSRGETDEFITPTVLTNTKVSPILDDNDAFILLNFRTDRAIELTSAMLQPEFPFFNRKRVLNNLFFVGMTEYAKGLPQNVAFPKENIALPLGRILAENDMRQLRIAESEKFPHVTYFFNGGRSIKFNGEDRVEVPSPNVPTYDQKPEMSLPEVTQILLEKLSLRIYDFIIVNIANPDMVGHTGVMDASVKAMEAVDQATKTIVKSVNALGGAVIVTSDHGNVEEMTNLKTGEIDTEHSLNPVPFIFVPPKKIAKQRKLQSGILADITPTILKLMGINKPEQMTGKYLIP